MPKLVLNVHLVSISSLSKFACDHENLSGNVIIFQQQ